MALRHASTYKPGPAKHSAADLPENRKRDDEYEGHNKDLADWYFRVLTGIYGQDIRDTFWF